MLAALQKGYKGLYSQNTLTLKTLFVRTAIVSCKERTTKIMGSAITTV